mmetsp:Transcript_34167/g.107711  ORF Transcript_34167/g.107711 Transcript_34167/m.107711 type:complete len:257 (-) Transcript_34167:1031-1801(-)
MASSVRGARRSEAARRRVSSASGELPHQHALEWVATGRRAEAEGELSAALDAYRAARHLLPGHKGLAERIHAVQMAIREGDAEEGGDGEPFTSGSGVQAPEQALAQQDDDSYADEEEDDLYAGHGNENDGAFVNRTAKLEETEAWDADAEIGLWTLSLGDIKSSDGGEPTYADISKAVNKEMRRVLMEQVMNVINTGTKEELMELRGIGPVRADGILAERKAEPFADMLDLDRIGVPGWQAKRIEDDNVRRLIERA